MFTMAQSLFGCQVRVNVGETGHLCGFFRWLRQFVVFQLRELFDENGY